MTIGRREFLLGNAASLVAKTDRQFTICSETFAGMNFADACKAARRSGYDAIEIEPAHLSPDPAALPAGARREIRNVIAGEGLACAGMHSLLKAPAQLHLTTPDAAVREKSWAYFGRLIDLAADLSGGPVMVLGSSKQREAIQGATPHDAAGRLADGLHALAPQAEKRGVVLLMEPLAPHLCNVIQNLSEAMTIVRAVDSPAVRTMFDCHNTAGETQPLPVLLKQYFPWIKHVHLNEMDGRRPGAGNFPFALLLRTLDDLGYSGRLSVEVFDFKPDGETVAKLALSHLRGLAL